MRNSIVWGTSPCPPASIALSAVFLLQDGRVAYTVPDKPNSRLQKYRITQAVQLMLKESAT